MTTVLKVIEYVIKAGVRKIPLARIHTLGRLFIYTHFQTLKGTVHSILAKSQELPFA